VWELLKFVHKNLINFSELLEDCFKGPQKPFQPKAFYKAEGQLRRLLRATPMAIVAERGVSKPDETLHIGRVT
jgi:hypothetical protein